MHITLVSSEWIILNLIKKEMRQIVKHLVSAPTYQTGYEFLIFYIRDRNTHCLYVNKG